MNQGIFRTLLDGGLAFWCPGCDEAHVVHVGKGSGPRWSFNGNHQLPTFSPSILVKVGHYCAGQDGKECWCTYEQRLGRPAPFRCGVCHSFVRDGRIEFLSDCTHALAGRTVDLPDFDAG